MRLLLVMRIGECEGNNTALTELGRHQTQYVANYIFARHMIKSESDRSPYETVQVIYQPTRAGQQAGNILIRTLPNSSMRGLSILSPPVVEIHYGSILEAIQSFGTAMEIIILVVDDNTATRFPAYFLQHGVVDSGVDPRLLNSLRPGETVDIDIDAKTRSTIQVPDGPALKQLFEEAAKAT